MTRGICGIDIASLQDAGGGAVTNPGLARLGSLQPGLEHLGTSCQPLLNWVRILYNTQVD
jgi:hypothetical protein